LAWLDLPFAIAIRIISICPHPIASIAISKLPIPMSIFFILVLFLPLVVRSTDWVVVSDNESCGEIATCPIGFVCHRPTE
jgi:hypothetical protein